MDEARDLDSVEGRAESGRRWTSKVDFDGCSEARRTSMGPETEARDFVGPVWMGWWIVVDVEKRKVSVFGLLE